jgi:hypothetical protein
LQDHGCGIGMLLPHRRPSRAFPPNTETAPRSGLFLLVIAPSADPASLAKSNVACHTAVFSARGAFTYIVSRVFTRMYGLEIPCSRPEPQLIGQSRQRIPGCAPPPRPESRNEAGVVCSRRATQGCSSDLGPPADVWKAGQKRAVDCGNSHSVELPKG